MDSINNSYGYYACDTFLPATQETPMGDMYTYPSYSDFTHNAPLALHSFAAVPPPSDNALRKYHELQSRQHAQVLQQLTQSSRDGCCQLLPTVGPAGIHPGSSIPMCNTQPRPPEQTGHHHHLHPYRYHQKLPHENTHILSNTGLYEETTSTSHFATTSMNSNPLHSNVDNPSNLVQSASLLPSPRTVKKSFKTHLPAGHSSIDIATPSYSAPPNGTHYDHSPTRVVCGFFPMADDTKPEKLVGTEGNRGLLKEEAADIVTHDSHARPKDKKRNEDRPHTNHPKRSANGNGSNPDPVSLPVKKRKKSKMHECQICHKNFPRPSGLKTHMNTHNNERPFPCPYPGCTRSFGVRSNAKRHLRTHGVIPPQSASTQPYVVDFSTPLVLEQQEQDGGGLGLNNGTDGAEVNSRDSDRQEEHLSLVPRQPTRPGRGRGRQFKLRWMPPSSSTQAKGKGKKKATPASVAAELPPPPSTGAEGEIVSPRRRMSRLHNNQMGDYHRHEGQEPSDDDDDDYENVDFNNDDDEGDLQRQDEDEEGEEDDDDIIQGDEILEEEFGLSTQLRRRVSPLSLSRPGSSSRSSTSASSSGGSRSTSSGFKSGHPSSTTTNGFASLSSSLPTSTFTATPHHHHHQQQQQQQHQRHRLALSPCSLLNPNVHLLQSHPNLVAQSSSTSSSLIAVQAPCHSSSSLSSPLVVVNHHQPLFQFESSPR